MKFILVNCATFSAKCFIGSITLAIASNCFAQNTFPTSGNVGIGTNTPESKLHVSGLTTLYFDDWGNDTLLFRGQKSTTNLWGEYAIRTSYLGLTFRNTQTNQVLFHIGGAGNGPQPISYFWPSGGKVGIGTISPGWPLEVNGTVTITSAFDQFSGLRLRRSGSASYTNREWSTYIGGSGEYTLVDATTSKSRFLIDTDGHANLIASGARSNRGLSLTNSDDSHWTAFISSLGQGAYNGMTAAGDHGIVFSDGAQGTGSFVIAPWAAATSGLRIDSSGNVSIGIQTATEKLSVNGRIRAREVIVENTGWADHVFAADYRLTPLSEVEKHIREKGTLPGVPSASEVESNGVSLNKMQALLLEKVEELTLHMIALEKENRALRERISKVEAAE
ncbi:hypothetical protein [Nibricoccus sp. IMCC34717]|uniref:hypothetical protein n=1 Tax=Nibricoccus sp. IMCC34717 TaxID=3034021 RepID=UPI003850AC3B